MSGRHWIRLRGAVTSCRLAQAGRAVCILERGKRWESTDFPRSPGELSRSFWEDNKSSGFLEYRAFRRVDVIQGCGVGGGSLHYFNVHLRAPVAIFERQPWPSEVRRANLDPYYSLAEDMLDSRPLTPPLGLDLPARTRAFLDAAAATGRKGELVPIGVHTGPSQPNRHSGKPQQPCDYSGNCLLGCSERAKNSLDFNYIAFAERNGAELFPEHQVESIEPQSDGRYRVHFRQLKAGMGETAIRGSVIGDAVILAAGTLGTTELLLRCRDQARKLPMLSPALGSRFSTNGDFLLAATSDADREIDPGRGPSITVAADFSTKKNLIFVEDLGFPEAFMWLLEGAIPRENRLANLARATWEYILATLGVYPGRVQFEADRLFRGGATTRLLPYLAIGTDAADGRMQLENGSVAIQWNHRRSRKMFDEIEDALKQLSKGINGTYRTSLLWRWPVRKLLTAHPLGGAFMGSDPKSSVTNHRGEVCYPKLYVADGSSIPSALAVNPSLTISAIAERVAFWILHGRDMSFDDRQTPRNC